MVATADQDLKSPPGWVEEARLCLAETLSVISASLARPPSGSWTHAARDIAVPRFEVGSHSCLLSRYSVTRPLRNSESYGR